MILILCNCEKNFRRVMRKWSINDNEEDIIIGTEDSNFFEVMRARRRYCIELLDTPLFSNRKDAVQIIEYLNSSLFNKMDRKYLYEIGMHIEGRGIEQAIADIVNECKKYNAFFSKYKIEKIYACCDEKNSIDVEVLRLYAKSGRIELKICYPYVRGGSDIQRHIYSCSATVNKYIKYVFYLCKSVIAFLKIFIKGKVSLHNKNNEKNQYECGRIWFSNAIKHYNWGKCKITVFNDNLSFNVICVDTDQEVKNRFINNGIAAVQVEDAGIILGSICKTIFNYYLEVVRLFKTIKSLNISFEGINLDEAIRFRIWQHVLLEVPHSIIVDEYVKNFLANNTYKYIEAWLGSNSIYTRIFHHYTRKENTIFFRVFNDIYSINHYVSREVENEMIDVLFIGRNNIYNIDKVYAQNGWNGECYFLSNKVAGQKQDEEVFSLSNPVKILWAPSYPLRGLFSATLWEQINIELLEELADFNAEIYVKYHLNQDNNSVLRMKQKYSSEKVHFIDKSDGIEMYIKNADVIITTPSLVVFDAMKHSKPVFVIRKEGMHGLTSKLEFLEYTSAKAVLNIVNALLLNEKLRLEKMEEQQKFVSEFLDIDEKSIYQEVVQLLKYEL